MAGVVSQQPHASLAVGEAQDRDLVLGCVAATRYEELQYRLSPVGGDRLCNVSLGRVGIRGSDGDAPLLLKARDERRQPVEPPIGADRERLLADDLGNLQHEPQSHNSREAPGRVDRM